MDPRILTVVFWTLFWSLVVATSMYERYLRRLMLPPTDATVDIEHARREIRVRGVRFSWTRAVVPSAWESLPWERKSSLIRRRSILNWAIAGSGVGVLLSFLSYARYELALIRAASGGSVPVTAMRLLNRPEVIIWLAVLAGAALAIAWVSARGDGTSSGSRRLTE